MEFRFPQVRGKPDFHPGTFKKGTRSECAADTARKRLEEEG